MQLSTRNATLEDLAALLRDQQAAKLDVVASAAKITSRHGRIVIAETGQPTPHPTEGLQAGDGVFVPTDIADRGIAEKLGIPVAYLRKLREERPDLYDANVNGWLHGGATDLATYPGDERKFLARCFRGDDTDDGIVRAFLSDGYGFYDHLDILTATLEGIRAAGTPIQIVGADLSESRMTLKVAAPEVAALAPILLGGYRSPFGDPDTHAQRQHGRFTQVRVPESEVDHIRRLAAAEGKAYPRGEEPIVFAGFVVSNSETGGGACQIVPQVTAEICMNGYKITRDIMRKVHLGTRLDEGTIQWSEDTQRKNLDLIVAQARDAVTTYLSPEYLERTVSWLEEKAGAPVTKAAETVQEVGRQLGFTQDRTDAILDHFIRGGQMTAGGVMNALTSYAQVIANPDDAAEVENQGVRAMELAAALR